MNINIVKVLYDSFKLHRLKECSESSESESTLLAKHGNTFKEFASGHWYLLSKDNKHYKQTIWKYNKYKIWKEKGEKVLKYFFPSQLPHSCYFR